jgi:hypothetical protein
MIVAIHQPHFLPWLGYMDRMKRADLFILLDHVQFEKQNYQNRVEIKTRQGRRWITVPVVRNSRSELILEKKVDRQLDRGQAWGRKVFLTLQHAYGKTPYFQAYAPRLQEILEKGHETLLDLNLELLEMMRRAFRIHTPIVRSSTLGVEGMKSELILGLCKAVKADAFMVGLGGTRDYLDRDAFAAAGIRLVPHEFSHPCYAQKPDPETFMEGLSSLDLLLNCGPGAALILDQRPVAPLPPARSMFGTGGPAHAQ